MKFRLPYSVLLIIAILAFLLPFYIAVTLVFSGGFAFWYDPARDFLLASDNLKKLTLIGPTSGIPGIFYGPYWIWLLSFGLLFSKDPRIVIFIALTLPYFLLLPYILWRLKETFGFGPIIMLWFLFIMGSGMQYATNPWNPHPAPLILIVIIAILISKNSFKDERRYLLLILFVGILSGLLLNFHISFGLAVSLGTFLFIFSRYFLQKKKNFKLRTNLFALGSYLSGIAITFLPFFIFEVRHGFHQLQTAMSVFMAKGSVVSVQGLSDMQILQQFAESFSKLLGMPVAFACAFIGIGVGLVIYEVRRRKVLFDDADRKLLLLLASIFLALLFLYLTSKNPVWAYHFLGVEILFLFLLGFLAKKSRIFAILLGIWIVVIYLIQSPAIIASLQSNRLSAPTLANKQYITTLIINDAKDQPYTVFAYSPSIYVYDYSYLFRWIGDKDVPYDPGNNANDAALQYVIRPQKTDARIEDFMNFRSPNSQYKTVKTWEISDGTIIMKRVRVENKK